MNSLKTSSLAQLNLQKKFFTRKNSEVSPNELSIKSIRDIEDKELKFDMKLK